jgi:hypothetical protein
MQQVREQKRLSRTLFQERTGALACSSPPLGGIAPKIDGEQRVFWKNPAARGQIRQAFLTTLGRMQSSPEGLGMSNYRSFVETREVRT